MSQQQGARLGPVAGRQQLGSSFLHVPAALPLVGQEVGAERGVQGRGDASDKEPGVEERGEELCVAGLSCLLEKKRREVFSFRKAFFLTSAASFPLLLLLWLLSPRFTVLAAPPCKLQAHVVQQTNLLWSEHPPGRRRASALAKQ